MKWLTNIFDPSHPDAKWAILTRPHEHPDEASRQQQKWLEGKIIGEPKAGHYSVEELKEMNMVGVYKTED